MASEPAAENIAVCIRVRPMNERERQAQDALALACVPQLRAVALLDPQSGAPLAGKGHAFTYDEVFDAASDAHAIYARVARRIVRSTLDGINGTIFAYGQTSSGKTYTMQGDGGMPFEPEAESCRPGILQLAVEDIFGFIERCTDRDFLLRVSFLEIYNEEVRDLLNPAADALKLREDPRKGVYVESTEEIITNYEDIVTLLRAGNRNRTVGQTAMNDQSSRSHSVFRIVIESKQKADSRRLSEEDVNGAVLVASLNLVDLAGSESLRHTAAEGIRQREAGNINKSLLTLARVINTLASSGGRAQNAPFRDSKLTRLLQNSLGGNTRTLIICCVTPSDRYIEETKSTLQFAARAKDIQTSATVNEVLDDQTQLRRLKREVHELKKLVNSEALNALKAENEALISEKNHNKTEMARLMGLILSSTSVSKTTVGKKRKQRGKRLRETWGPGDFPTSIKALAPLSPNLYPRKRHSPAKENMDPQTIFRVYEENDRDMTKKADNPAFDTATTTKMKSTDASSKNVLDLFSAVIQKCCDAACEDPITAIESIANEKSASLGDVERIHVFEVLAELRTLMISHKQYRSVQDEKLALEKEVKDLRSKREDENTTETPARCDCSENASKASALVDEIMAELVSTQENLAKQQSCYHELDIEKTNCQQMAAEELDALRFQLETLKLELSRAQDRFHCEKRQLEAALEALQLSPDDDERMRLRSRENELESLLKEMKASQTVLQMAVAERDDEIALLKAREAENKHTELATPMECSEEGQLQKISEVESDNESAAPTEMQSRDIGKKDTLKQATAADQSENGVVEKLAGELQDIMQELAQLQSDHERTATEKETLQAQIDKINEELEVSRRQGYEMSEALMEKEHVAKVLKAQLDAKLMTISQMQTKHGVEVEILQQTIQNLTMEKEQLLSKINDFDVANETTEKTAKATAIDVTPNIGDADEHLQAQELHSEIEQLTTKLSAVEAELDETKARLQASMASAEGVSEQTNLQAAHEKLKVDFSNQLQANKANSSQAISSSEQNTEALDLSLQQRYDTLNEEYKTIADELEKMSRERNDCLEELRALECQLMEVSEEKMKLAIAADEQDIKLQEAQQAATSSAKTISTLQTQLEEACSTKTALETSKAELEQNVSKVQSALADLQADHATLVEQMQRIESVSNTCSGSSTSDAELLQQRLDAESKQSEKLRLDVQSYEETLSVLREEAKDSSATIADLLEKTRRLEIALESAFRTQDQKDKEISSLADALTRSEEEKTEMRLQSKQRLVAAEGKEMALEEKISALTQQLNMFSAGVAVPGLPMESDTQAELTQAREKVFELLGNVTALESQLAEAHQALRKQDEEWNKKQAMAEKEFERLTTEQRRLLEQLSVLQSNAGISQHEMTTQAEELLEAKQFCAQLSNEKEAIQRELDAVNASWEEKQQELTRQLDSIREQYQEAQTELEEFQKSADGEIHRLRSVVEETEAEIEELKRSAKAREEELESQIGEQEDWQNQVKSRQEALQAKCEELDDERQLLKKKYAALKAQRGDIEEQLRSEIHELSQKYSTAQAQQAIYQGKLKEMQSQLEMTENDVSQSRSEAKSLAESLKSSQMEAVQYHNKIVEAQLAKESVDKLVEKQKARIDKLEKVKMTTETLYLFRKLKKDRHDLQIKVQALQDNLDYTKQALAQTQEDHHGKEQRVVKDKNEELRLLKEHVEELREALRAEKHQVADIKSEMRAALKDEREKAEHEIQEMQALVKEKMDLVEKLEAEVASVKDAMVKLREQKSENVSYLEKENLDLHVENRELKKRLESSVSALPENDEFLGDTGIYDASAAAAAKVLAEDSNSAPNEIEASDSDSASAEATKGAAKAGGFLLSTTELDAIAANSQEDPKEGERPECSQQ